MEFEDWLEQKVWAWERTSIWKLCEPPQDIIRAMKYSRLAILFVSLYLSGCFSVLPLRVETPAPYATYKITEVVDAFTAQAISDNMLFLTIRRDGVEEVQFFRKI